MKNYVFYKFVMMSFLQMQIHNAQVCECPRMVNLTQRYHELLDSGGRYNFFLIFCCFEAFYVFVDKSKSHVGVASRYK